MRQRLPPLGSALLLVACQGASPGPAADSGAGKPPNAPAVSAMAPSAPAVSAMAPSGDAGGREAANAGAVVVENLAQPGAFEVRAGRAPVSLTLEAGIEAQAKGVWGPTSAHFVLSEACKETPAPCVELAAGARLRPAPWNGWSCSGQCGGSCKKNVFLPPGTFRLVVRSCDGKDRYEGPPFEMPAEPRPRP